MINRYRKPRLELVLLLVLLPAVAIGQVQDPADDSTYSAPGDRKSYVRPLTAKDLNPLGLDTGAAPPSIFLRNLVVHNTDPTLFEDDTASDSEPSIAINPNNPDEIVILAFSGGWGGGSAPLWHTTDGGLTWSKLNTIGNPGVYGSNCPCDQAPDWGLDGNLYITFLECMGNNCDIVSGSTADPTSLAAWNWSDDAVGIAEILNQNPVLSSDQPWLLVNTDPNNPGNELVHNAYDDFSVSPRGMQVMTAPTGDPPNFNSDDDNVGSASSGVNPGHRQAKDTRTGFIYSLWQDNQGGADPKNINYMLNRSTDGGVTWGLNGSATGIVVANGDSTQPTPKFGTVNALLGGVLHAAVDSNLGHVYYVYGDQDGSGFDRLSIARLQDDGTGTLVVASDVDLTGQVEAALPSVAVTSDGTVGVFYYTFDGFSSDSIPIFSAWLALSRDLGVTFDKELMLTFLASATDDGNSKQRLLGDYVQMKSVGRTFFGVFTANGAVFGRPMANHDPYFFKQTVGPIIDIDSPNDFGMLCDGDLATKNLDITNTGPDVLVVENVSVLAGGDSEIALRTTPTTPVTLNTGNHIGFTVECEGGTPGVKTATVRILSTDPDQPVIDIQYTCEFGTSAISTLIADNGDFGDVCRDDFKDLDLTINNPGDCELTVSAIASDDAEFEVANVMAFPLVVAPGDSTAVPIRFVPTTLGAASATISITSDAPGSPSEVTVSGNTPPGDVRVTGSTDFGDVCAGGLAEQMVAVCNVGACNLDAMSASIDCADFTLINNPLRAPISPDSCLDLTIRFTPQSAGPKTCTLTILTDDPDTPSIELTLTGNTPLPMIDVPPDQAFPPTVIQEVDACRSELAFPVSSVGQCPLTITDFEVTTNTDEYSLLALPSFPIILDPGHIAGDGALTTAFEPDVLDRARLGEVSVTYIAEPILMTPVTISRALCGEGVRTGARVLVTHGGVPLDEVKAIRLKRINANRNGNKLDTVDGARNVLLQTEVPAGPCGPFQYHREYSTVDNPIQLLPGSFQVTVQARIDGKMKHLTVGFDVSSCDFNPTVVVDF